MSIIGLSTSDVFLVASFTGRIISALREGGAKTQYQEVVRSLESLRRTLQEIQDLSSSTDDVRLRLHFAAQTDHSISLISSFAQKIAKYEKFLGQKASKSLWRGTFRKTYWALSAARDLDDFRKTLAPQLDAIKLIISKETL
jgi:hypothetical protein